MLNISSPNSIFKDHHLSSSSSSSSSSARFHRPETVAFSKSKTYPGTRRPTNSCREMAASAPTCSLYEVLGISVNADCHQIKAAYRKLARSCHPDVVAMNRKEYSAAEFMKIHAAYSTLSDPDKRASYDRDLYFSRNKRPVVTSMSRNSAYKATSRNWESDQCW